MVESTAESARERALVARAMMVKARSQREDASAQEKAAAGVRVVGGAHELPVQWDRYVHASAEASIYHLSGWRGVISRVYGKDSYYLIAELPRAEGALAAQESPGRKTPVVVSAQTCRVVGILPLIHMRHWMFGNSLVSIPYFDCGGILAESPVIANLLLAKSLELASEFGASMIELRQAHASSSRLCGSPATPETIGIAARARDGKDWSVGVDTEARVRMILDLPNDPEVLMGCFKAKLRSQIHKPIKHGLRAVVGGGELLKDFYSVFAENMRDLGSPVHSARLMEKTLLAFPETARIFVVYGGGAPIAASLVIGFKGMLLNPWASSLRRHRDLSPNMLLYWSMMEFGCRNGFIAFDFGRSRVGEGSYRFKKQWGARAVPLGWIRAVRGAADASNAPDRDRMSLAMSLWKRIPVSVTKIIGPPIRAGISL